MESEQLFEPSTFRAGVMESPPISLELESASDLEKIRALFDAAAEAHGDERRLLLDAAEPGLREIVEGLLKSDEASHPVLDRPLVVPLPQHGLLESGDCAGRYRIVHEIGSGGM